MDLMLPEHFPEKHPSIFPAIIFLKKTNSLKKINKKATATTKPFLNKISSMNQATP